MHFFRGEIEKDNKTTKHSMHPGILASQSSGAHPPSFLPSLARAGRRQVPERRDTSPRRRGICPLQNSAVLTGPFRTSPPSQHATIPPCRQCLCSPSSSGLPHVVTLASTTLSLRSKVLHVRYILFSVVRTLVSESWVHDAACWAAGAKALADAASARMLEAMQVFMIDN